jgi:hypothetical protein
MALRWLSAVAALAAAAPAGAQQVKELGIHTTGTLSDPALAVGGLYAAWRPSARGRVAATLGIGGSDGEVAWRGEAGVGGGARLSLGYRWRWRPAWSRLAP